MTFHFQSWEFLFGMNIALVFIYPFLVSKISNEKILNSVLFFLPAFLASIENFFFKADLDFHLKLSILHWGVSLLSIYGLWKFLPPERRILKYFLMVFISLGISFLKFLYSPSLVWLDPFWGIVPGTISIDPIISLDPYLYRLVVLLLVSATFLSYRSPRWFLASFWVVSMALGAVPSSPFVFSKALSSRLQKTEKYKQIQIIFETKKSSSFTPWSWAREFSFYLDRIQKRLPKSAEFKSNTDYKIYFYNSDDSKADSIGARQTEIGNFLQGEMHLSHLVPGVSTLAHELAHLVHGKLVAPLESYIDPFLLEGLAEALSSETADETLDKTAALVQVMSLQNWPRGKDFIVAYAPSISYALAAGYATRKLVQNEWPWEGAPIETGVFKERKVSDLKLAWAKKMLERKSLFKDPLVRDCTRLEWEYSKLKSPENLAKLESICPDWKKNPHYQESETDLKLLEKFLDRIEDIHLKALKRKFYMGMLANDPKILAQEILKSGRIPISAAGQAFRERLDWEVKN